MKQETIAGYEQDAKDFAKAEKELKIENWVYISFETHTGEVKKLHHYDIPRHFLVRWLWLINWRTAKLTCENPRANIKVYYSYYDKRTGLKTGFNTLLSKTAAAKAQITKVERKIQEYIKQETGNNLFFDAQTDELLQKAREKLKQKYANLAALQEELKEEVRKQNECIAN